MSAVFGLLFLALLCYVGWRVFRFLVVLLAPVRAAVKPLMDPVNAHVEDSLRKTGLGKIADFGKAIDSSVESIIKKAEGDPGDGRK